MTEDGHAAVELALAVAVMLLPVALMVTSFGPWSERRVVAEAAAAEAARALAVDLDHATAADLAARLAASHGLEASEVRLGWCGATPGPVDSPAGWCALARGGVVAAAVEVWTPLVMTPWGGVGGLWARGSHSEPIDLYRSFP